MLHRRDILLSGKSIKTQSYTKMLLLTYSNILSENPHKRGDLKRVSCLRDKSDEKPIHLPRCQVSVNKIQWLQILHSWRNLSRHKNKATITTKQKKRTQFFIFLYVNKILDYVSHWKHLLQVFLTHKHCVQKQVYSGIFFQEIILKIYSNIAVKKYITLLVSSLCLKEHFFNG